MECYGIQRQRGCTGAWMQNSEQRLESDCVDILAFVAWSPLPLLMAHLRFCLYFASLG
jgi:hypothetical protein